MTLANPLKALLLSLACLALFGCTSNPASVKVEQLLKTSQSWDGAPYGPYPAGQPEITVLKIIIPAHTALDWHMHPMPNVAYVLSGELHVETRDGKHKTTVKAGDILPEVVQTKHRGTSGNTSVELIVFMPAARACHCRSKQPVRYFLMSLWLVALPASAQVYKYLDAQGAVHYSSTPRDITGSEPITLEPLNIQPALDIAPPDNPQQLLPEQERAHPPYSVLKIDGLPVEQALRANNGTFTVQLTIAPPLNSQHRLQWLLDGLPYGEPDTQTVMQMNNIDRGMHHLSVQVMEGDKTVQQSQMVVFYLQRAHQR